MKVKETEPYEFPFSLYHSCSDKVDRKFNCLYSSDMEPLEGTEHLVESVRLAHSFLVDLYDHMDDVPNLEVLLMYCQLQSFDWAVQTMIDTSLEQGHSVFKDKDGSVIKLEDFIRMHDQTHIEPKIRSYFENVEKQDDVDHMKLGPLAILGLLITIGNVVKFLSDYEAADIANCYLVDVLFWLPKVATFYAKETSKNETIKESKQRAAKARHAETESFRKEVILEWEKNKLDFKSIADAGRKLDPLVPVTQDTIKRWISAHEKKNK